MLVGKEGDFQLGADTIGAGNQNRIVVSGSFQIEKGTKTAKPTTATLTWTT